MLLKLENHLTKNLPFLKEKKLLLATSGGIDSMVMLHLFQKLNYNIAIAHCNFQLRGLESFGDQQFVQEYASKNKIPAFVTHFDTENFAKDYKLSTQIAARELRYNWFYELLETENFDFILTAHHADDNLETFIINLTRGTGLDGLTGIPEQNEQIIRPLLPFSRSEIEEYTKENSIQWREDSSNASDKYLRNKIRHDLIPILKVLNPNFLDSFLKTQNYLQEAQVMIEDATIMIYQQVAKEDNEIISFDLKKLTQLPNYKSYLYQWLREYDFTAWEDIYNLVESQSGKQIFSKKYRLLKDRDFLILSLIKELENEAYFIKTNQKEVKIPLNFSICKVNDISSPKNTIIFVDEDKLQFPLTIRKRNEGDSFYPSGMKGKKKLSKYFKDEKMSLIEKENTWLLCSKNKIVWVIGKRADQQFVANKTTQNIIKLELL
ncbi:tRNA lysidine(34) synthetase TilS [Flavobacterium psychrophilum]|uniref:tRNA lysidine(34) synthetase TilS n=1 Tax=Flavobacterium psychrophilum TaxID=96345 RepID=UPI0004F601AD|nr:tRNA lysidine(34) synthetase TilS [Flavobacterium psychrophilum]AIN74586.1 potassium ABC transporter ATPase [Flavobacterium psychrophilum FPG3]EKT2068272.1 tRNA lysidine(34) synthetase TilS [Flavobacterium psychrophilum]EKT2072371.1 tRNA lysidine(34) synthetase TilS [Flavobacterium psychrophilum]EKT4491863.1 tRNA lysidine(34) synthetase TilS [Flavobacterium psychrophilum]EKT4508436.1 tRNA lysidine(34) synthetase TilS [Flavobacterium psychrophilum]